MRDVSASMIPGGVRTISGRAKVYQRIPTFTRGSDSFSCPNTDVYSFGTGMYRAYNDHGTVYLQYALTLPSGLSSWTILPISAMADGVISIYLETLFYQKSNGDVVRRALSGGAETVLANFSDPVALAAVSSTEVYVMYKVSDLQYGIKKYPGGSTWHGGIYGHGESFKLYAFDAIREDSVDYIYYQEPADKNARYVKYAGGSWSDTRLVFPLDVVDDTFSFRFGSVSKVGDRVVIVGTMIRNDTIMKIYSFGPEQCSLGRAMYIGIGYDQQTQHGKMVMVDDELYVLGGDGNYFSADPTIIFGDDYDTLSSDVGIISVKFSSEANRPSRATFELDSSTPTTYLKSGNIIDWYASIDTVEELMGRFAIDSAPSSDEETGESLSVVARSLSLKRLATWASDASFDYWSQTKQVSEASDMGELLRGLGVWEEDGNTLEYLRFNKRGWLHTAQRACRNGSAVGKFRVPSATSYWAGYGVGITFYREPLSVAEERLGYELDTTFGQDDSSNFCLFFGTGNDGDPCWLSIFEDNTSTKLAYGDSLPETTDWIWLKIDFHEGHVTCWYRTDTDWVKVLEHTFVATEDHPSPWFEDEIGKAAILVHNVTPYSDDVSFGTYDEVIPLDDNYSWPETGIVQVDTEYISYDSKSPNNKIETLLNWVDGKSYPILPEDRTPAPHPNTNEFEVSELFANEETQVDDGNPSYARTSAQSFVATDAWNLTSVELYLKKQGTEARNVTVWIGNDDSDECSWANPDDVPDSVILARRTRQFNYGEWEEADAGGGAFTGNNTYAWVRFNLSAKLNAGEAYWIHIVDDAHGTGLDDLEWGQQFLFGLSENIHKDRYLYRTWHSGDWHDAGENTNRNMMFRVHGRSATGTGYEIYVDTVGTSLPTDYYNDCALMCVDGPGEGRAMRITGYDYYAPYQWVANDNAPGNSAGDLSEGEWVDQHYRRFFVSQDPNVFGEGSQFYVKPALVIDERAVDVEGEDVASPHYDTRASLYVEDVIEVDEFQYFSGEKDMTLGWMLTEIARKANVLTVDEEFRDTSTIPSTYSTALASAEDGESAIMEFDVSSWSSGKIGMIVYGSGLFSTGQADAVEVLVSETAIEYYKYAQGSGTLAESIPLSMGTNFTISFQKDSFAVWDNDRLVAHFDWPASQAQESTFYRGFKVSPIKSGSISCTVNWSELDSRVDNFILDIGQSGLSLMQRLIGEKRVFILDDRNGDMRLFRNREVVNPTTAIDLQIAQSIAGYDNEIKTRLRGEGVEVSEIADDDALREYGNLFALIGLQEPDSIAEINRELKLIMEDSLLSNRGLMLMGAADPRLEPEDIVRVEVNGTTIYGVIVKSMNMIMSNDGKQPTFDMRFDGLIKTEEGSAPYFLTSSDIGMVEETESNAVIRTQAADGATITLGD